MFFEVPPQGERSVTGDRQLDCLLPEGVVPVAVLTHQKQEKKKVWKAKTLHVSGTLISEKRATWHKQFERQPQERITPSGDVGGPQRAEWPSAM